MGIKVSETFCSAFLIIFLIISCTEGNPPLNPVEQYYFELFREKLIEKNLYTNCNPILKGPETLEKFFVCVSISSVERKTVKQDDGDDGEGAEGPGAFAQIQAGAANTIGLIAEAVAGLNMAVNMTTGSSSVPGFVFSSGVRGVTAFGTSVLKLWGIVTQKPPPKNAGIRPAVGGGLPLVPITSPVLGSGSAAAPGGGEYYPAGWVTPGPRNTQKPRPIRPRSTTNPYNSAGSSGHFLGPPIPDDVPIGASGQFFPAPQKRRRRTTTTYKTIGSNEYNNYEQSLLTSAPATAPPFIQQPSPVEIATNPPPPRIPAYNPPPIQALPSKLQNQKPSQSLSLPKPKPTADINAPLAPGFHAELIHSLFGNRETTLGYNFPRTLKTTPVPPVYIPPTTKHVYVGLPHPDMHYRPNTHRPSIGSWISSLAKYPNKRPVIRTTTEGQGPHFEEEIAEITSLSPRPRPVIPRRTRPPYIPTTTEDPHFEEETEEIVSVPVTPSPRPRPAIPQRTRPPPERFPETPRPFPSFQNPDKIFPSKLVTESSISLTEKERDKFPSSSGSGSYQPSQDQDRDRPLSNRRPVIVNNMYYPDLESALAASKAKGSGSTSSPTTSQKPRRRRRTTTTTPSPSQDPDYYEEGPSGRKRPSN